MFDRSYSFDIQHPEDHWWFTQMVLKDASLFRMHIIRKNRSDNLLGLDVDQYEFNFDRGSVNTPENLKHTLTFPNGMGDAMRIYSTVYRFCKTFVITHNPDVFGWGAGTDKTLRIYSKLGQKWYKDKAYGYHPVQIIQTPCSIGNAVLGIKKELLENISDEYEYQKI